MEHKAMKNIDELLNCLRSDNEALARAAFKFTYEILHRKLLKTAKKFLKSNVLAEDLVHDVFSKIWKTRKGFHSIRSLEYYFISVVSYTALVYLKKMARYKLVEQAYVKNVDLALNAEFEFPDAETDEKHSHLIHAIEQLPSQQKQAIMLSYFHGLGREEIRKRMGLASSTVGHYLTFGRKGIKAYLRKRGL